MGIFDAPELSDVDDIHSFLHYASYSFGTETGVPTSMAFWRIYATFLERFPEWQGRIGWQQLAKAVDWGVKRRRTRPKEAAFVLWWVAEAVEGGAIPELVKKSKDDLATDDFYNVLSVEEDPGWRKYLMSTHGAARKQAMLEWRQYRG